MGFTLETEFLHGHSQMNLGAVVVLNGRILATNQLNQFTALHANALFALLGFTNTILMTSAPPPPTCLTSSSSVPAAAHCATA